MEQLFRNHGSKCPFKNAVPLNVEEVQKCCELSPCAQANQHWCPNGWMCVLFHRSDGGHTSRLFDCDATTADEDDEAELGAIATIGIIGARLLSAKWTNACTRTTCQPVVGVGSCSRVDSVTARPRRGGAQRHGSVVE
jgi:hypothetical protein